METILGEYEHLPRCMKCSFRFHFGKCSGNDAASWKKRGADGRKKWVCHLCNPSKNLSNSNTGVTPAPSAHAGATVNDSVTVHQEDTDVESVELPQFADVDAKCDFIMKQVMQVMGKVTLVLDELRSVRSEITVIKEKANRDAIRITELEKIVDEKSAYIEEVDYKSRALEDYSRVDNLIFHGLPPASDEEEAASFVVKAAKFVGIEMSNRDICIAHSLRAARGGPVKLVCRFLHRWQRGKLQAAINSAKITTENLELPGEPQNIVAMDHLSPATSILYAEARNSLALRNGGEYEFVWMKNRRVFIRKREKEAVIEVKTMAQLDRLRRGRNLGNQAGVARPAQ